MLGSILPGEKKECSQLRGGLCRWQGCTTGAAVAAGSGAVVQSPSRGREPDAAYSSGASQTPYLSPFSYCFFSNGFCSLLPVGSM